MRKDTRVRGQGGDKDVGQGTILVHTEKPEGRVARWREKLCMVREHQEHLSWDALASQQSSPGERHTQCVSSLSKGPSQVLKGQEAL